MWLALLRAFVVVLLAHAGYVYSPVPQRPWTGLAMGVALAFGLFALEMALRRMPGPQMVGALIGGTTGLFGARLLWANLEGVDIASQHFVHIAVIAFLTYMGVVIGVAKGDWFEPARIIAAFKDSARLHQYKILDTSVIIDGRVADLCETGFLEGTLVVPQFVLRELQQVADSSDSMKRNRGRRGLDILQKIQKMTGIHVQVVETDFPEVREVDLKLIELARRMSGKIVTNDFNLNKVAQLRGVAVLNINELANALKPVVLPGEILRVFVLKEGKESGQGVGYLDDGTMIVVDQGRRAIGRTIDVTVTSVLQTTAGKMIFCRWPDAGPDDAERPRRAANGRERHSGRIMDGRLTPMSSPAVSPTDPRLAELASSESLTPPSGTPTPTPTPSPERAKAD